MTPDGAADSAIWGQAAVKPAIPRNSRRLIMRLSRYQRGLQALIVGPGSAFRHGPGDDAVGILDVAGFAMDAVGGVDLQSLAAGAIVHHLVDGRGAEILAGIAELGDAARRADRRVVHLEVHGLVLVVHVAGMEYGGEPVARRELARNPAALDLRSVFELVQRQVVLVMRQRPRTPARDHGLKGGI